MDSSTAWLWLISVPHQCRRYGYGNSGSGSAYNFQRKRLHLLPWIESRCKVAGIDFLNDSKVTRSMTVRYDVIGLVQVRLGHRWESNLTVWSREAEFLRAYLCNPTDAYVVHVLQTFCFQVPLLVGSMRRAGRNGIAKICVSDTRSHVLHPNFYDCSMLEHAGVTRDGLNCSLRDFCIHSRINVNDLPGLLGVVVVDPISKLVIQRMWHDIVLRGSWKLPRPLFTVPLAADLAKLPAEVEKPDESPIAHEDLVIAIDAVRSWAPKLIAAADELEERPQQTMLLQKVVSLLCKVDRLLFPDVHPDVLEDPGAMASSRSYVTSHICRSYLRSSKD